MDAEFTVRSLCDSGSSLVEGSWGRRGWWQGLLFAVQLFYQFYGEIAGEEEAVGAGFTDHVPSWVIPERRWHFSNVTNQVGGRKGRRKILNRERDRRIFKSYEDMNDKEEKKSECREGIEIGKSEDFDERRDDDDEDDDEEEDDDDEDDDDEDEGVSQNSNYGSKGLFHLVYLMTSVRYTAITRARMIRRFRLTLSIIRVVLDCS